MVDWQRFARAEERGTVALHRPESLECRRDKERVFFEAHPAPCLHKRAVVHERRVGGTGEVEDARLLAGQAFRLVSIARMLREAALDHRVERLRDVRADRFASRALVMAFATPTSTTTACESSARRMLSGLMSRCTTPLAAHPPTAELALNSVSGSEVDREAESARHRNPYATGTAAFRSVRRRVVWRLDTRRR